jgi:predicted MFS family arabinose efflux permease
VISLVLVGYGLGTLLGTYVGGRLGNSRPLATQLGAVVIAGTALAMLQSPLSKHAVAAVALLVVMGIAAQSDGARCASGCQDQLHQAAGSHGEMKSP